MQVDRLKEGHSQSEKSLEARERINRQRVKALEDQVCTCAASNTHSHVCYIIILIASSVDLLCAD